MGGLFCWQRMRDSITLWQPPVFELVAAAVHRTAAFRWVRIPRPPPTKKATRWVAFFCWQRMRDSNPRERSQSPVCYRYTNPLWAEQLYYTQFFGNVKGEFHFFRPSAAPRGNPPRVIPGQVSQCPPPRPAPLWAGRRRFSGSPGWTPRKAPAPWTCRSPCRRSRPYPSGRPPSPHRRSGS